MNGMRVMAVAAVVAVGVAAGATLTEAVVLVPYWQALEPEAFLQWFAAHEPRLVAFYGPLEVISTALIVTAAGLYLVRGLPGAGLLMASAVCSLAILAVYPIYFQGTNTAFVNRTIQVDAVAAELVRWGRWHWFRVGLGILATVCAAAGVAASGQARRRTAQIV